ncbi:hypothetical protein HYW46_00465 [Candidatus Daviesbacteria bacterium]|nr:hypothetical protein [Candidatus Daviesbacteria bacterium]
MSKYDLQLGDLKNQVSSASNILIFLPTKITVDKLAAALSLMLSLQQSGKRAALVTQDTIRVSHTNLYGVGDVANELPKGGGDLTLMLEGVVDSSGKIPALEKLDWYPEGANLNLVFHVVPGQRFEPVHITPKYQGGAYNMIFTIGAGQPNQLGAVYQQNIQSFQNIPLINIDNSSLNSNFGSVNIVDPATNSISEMMIQLIPGLGLNLDGDIATNILTGIYDATGNLTNNLTADTFISLGQAMQAGGRVQGQSVQTPQPVQTPVQPASGHASPIQYSEPPQQEPAVQGFDLSKVFQIPVTPPADPAGSPPAGQQPQQPQTEQVQKKIGATNIQPQQDVPSPEEVPSGEFAATASPDGGTPTPDWLTPKIYRGGG